LWWAPQVALIQADRALGAMIETLPRDTIIVVTSGRGCEGGTHVPLFLRTNEVPARVDGIVSTMDIAPTLFDAADIRRPQRIQGQNLLADPPRGWAFARLRHPDLPRETTLLTEQWKIVMTEGPQAPTFRLYNLETDPEAKVDLSGKAEHAEALDHMIDLMMDTRVALEDRTEPRIASF